MPTDPSGSPETDWLSEDQAHRLLARAVELDTQSMSDVSIAQLRDIAAEAGISPRAVERALEEFRDGARVQQGTDSSHHRVRSVRLRGLYEVLTASIDSRQLARYRRHAIVASVSAAAIITPGDIVTTTAMLAAPLYAMYELAILSARFKGRRRNPLQPFDERLRCARFARTCLDALPASFGVTD